MVDKEKIGKKIGYLFGYFLFTTILYFILTILDKMPENWGYFHIMGITGIISIIGIMINRWLR